ncbi:MAG: mechanosensitive ion channel domain-containing protein [Candidatus Woesearchaeota archaeon]
MVILVVFVLAMAVKLLYDKFVSSSIKNYKLIFNRIIYALILLLIATGFHFSLSYFDLPVETDVIIKVLIMLISLYIFFLLTNYFTDNIMHIWYKGKIKSKLQIIIMLNYAIKLFVVVFIVFMLFKFWNIDLLMVFRNIIELIKQNRLTYSISIFLVYLIIAKFVLYVFKTYFTEVVKKTKTKMDDIIVVRIEYPLSWIIVLAGIIVALNSVDFGEQYIIPIVNTIIIVIVVHTLIKLSDDLFEEWWQEKPEKTSEDIIQMTNNFVKILVIIVGLAFVLVIWGLDLKSLLLSVGIISVILGFALKGTLDNVFSGISLMLDHTFRVGDVIKLESGELGEVVHIGLRSTHVKTYDHELLVVPNSVLANMRVINYAKPDKNLRIVIPVNVVYGTNIDKVKKVLLESVEGIKAISLPAQTIVMFIGMGDFSLNFKVMFYIDDYRKKFRTENKAYTQIYNALKKNKIEIPFPTRTLYMHNGKKANNGKGKKKIR